MTIPNEVAAVLAEMRALKIPNWPAGRILGDLADRIESALTKAEADGMQAAAHINRAALALIQSLPPPGIATGEVFNQPGADTVPPPAPPAESPSSDSLRKLQKACFEAIATERRTGQFSRADVLLVMSAAAELKPAAQVSSDYPDPPPSMYPACSGKPDACPENKGKGCCAPNMPPVGRDVDAIYEAFKTWPDDIRRKLSFHDLRRMNGWVPPKPPVASVPDGLLKEARDIQSGFYGDGQRMHLAMIDWAKKYDRAYPPTNQEGAAP